MKQTHYQHSIIFEETTYRIAYEDINLPNGYSYTSDFDEGCIVYIQKSKQSGKQGIKVKRKILSITKNGTKISIDSIPNGLKEILHIDDPVPWFEENMCPEIKE